MWHLIRLPILFAFRHIFILCIMLYLEVKSEQKIKFKYMKKLLLLVLTGIIISSCADKTVISSDDVVIENDQMKLVISGDGIARSLIYKPGNCLLYTSDAADDLLCVDLGG